MLPSRTAARAYLYVALLFLTLFALLVLFAPGLSAQSLRIGTEFGTDLAAAEGEDASLSFAGWSAAATANLDLIGPIGLEASLHYTSRTGRTTVGGGLVGVPDFVGNADKFFSEERSEFLSLPISLRVDLGSPTSGAPFFYAGTTLGVLFDAADLDPMPDKIPLAKRTTDNADAAPFARADFGAGIRMPAGRGFDVEIEARTSWDVPGLGNRASDAGWRMNSMRCVVGLNYRLF